MSPADRPIPYTLTPKALAALDTAPDRPVPVTLTAKALAVLDQDGTR
jgi:hypothetical protein